MRTSACNRAYRHEHHSIETVVCWQFATKAHEVHDWTIRRSWLASFFSAKYGTNQKSFSCSTFLQIQGAGEEKTHWAREHWFQYCCQKRHIGKVDTLQNSWVRRLWDSQSCPKSAFKNSLDSKKWATSIQLLHYQRYMLKKRTFLACSCGTHGVSDCLVSPQPTTNQVHQIVLSANTTCSICQHDLHTSGPLIAFSHRMQCVPPVGPSYLIHRVQKVHPPVIQSSV